MSQHEEFLLGLATSEDEKAKISEAIAGIKNNAISREPSLYQQGLRDGAAGVLPKMMNRSYHDGYTTGELMSRQRGLYEPLNSPSWRAVAD